MLEAVWILGLRAQTLDFWVLASRFKKIGLGRKLNTQTVSPCGGVKLTFLSDRTAAAASCPGSTAKAMLAQNDLALA